LGSWWLGLGRRGLGLCYRCANRCRNRFSVVWRLRLSIRLLRRLWLWLRRLRLRLRAGLQLRLCASGQLRLRIWSALCRVQAAFRVPTLWVPTLRLRTSDRLRGVWSPDRIRWLRTPHRLRSLRPSDGLRRRLWQWWRRAWRLPGSTRWVWRRIRRGRTWRALALVSKLVGGESPIRKRPAPESAGQVPFGLVQLTRANPRGNGHSLISVAIIRIQ
jgi:hypothetical protein